MTSVITHLGNLPASFTTFVGRSRELAEIRRLLGVSRLVTLTGVGGVGKTRLALATAAASTRAFADGAWVVDLAAIREPSAVPATAATALGVPDLGSRPVLDQLTSHLARRRALLVLDNSEHLVEGCVELAQRLLTAASELRLLATSRQTLGITGEHVFAVPPLPQEEAVQLLGERTTAVRPEFQITDANRAAVTRLCIDLDGLPLAIELAASRMRTLSAEQVADRLEDRFALLTSGSRTARPQQRTLRAAIDWSYELCTPDERLLWNRLSVFAGGFGLNAAEDVCSGDGISRHEVLELLDRLVTQSVAMVIEHEGMPRYRMLETIRQYGMARLVESGEAQRLRQQHRDFHLSLVERIADGWFGPSQEAGLARMRIEHDNLRAALDFGDDTQGTLALAAALRFHWCVGGFLGEGRRRLEGALAAAPEPTLARARALWVAGWVALLQLDHAAAERWLDEADELGGRLGDSVVVAYSRTFRGTLASFRGRVAEAASLLEAAMASHMELGEATGAIFSTFQLCSVLSDLGDPRTVEVGRRGVALAETSGELWGRAHVLGALALDAWKRGELKAGIALVRSGLELQRGFNDYVGAALMLDLFAWATAAEGDHQQAARLLGAIRALCRNSGTHTFDFRSMAAEHARWEETIQRALGARAFQKALAEGAAYDHPGQAIAYALSAGIEPTTPSAAPSQLTRREREVAALVAQGMTNRQIAAELVLSPRTVAGHIQNIMTKLGYGRRTQIATWWAAHQAPVQ